MSLVTIAVIIGLLNNEMITVSFVLLKCSTCLDKQCVFKVGKIHGAIPKSLGAADRVIV